MKIEIKDFMIYLKSEKLASIHTIEAYQRDLKNFLNFVEKCEIKDWKSVSLDLVMEYLALKKVNKSAEASIYRCLVAIKSFFRFLKRENWIESNEIKLLSSPKIWLKIPLVLTQEEVEKLIQQPDISTEIGARDRAIMEVLYSTGLRVSELCRLRLLDVDDTYLRVQGKGNKDRIIPIGSKGIQAIDHYLAFREKDLGRGAYLFISKRGKQLGRKTIWNLVKEYANQANLSLKVSPHTFRHSYATHLLIHGADLRIIQELLGHASISSTDRYTQMNQSEIQQAFERFHPRLLN